MHISVHKCIVQITIGTGARQPHATARPNIKHSVIAE